MLQNTRTQIQEHKPRFQHKRKIRNTSIDPKVQNQNPNPNQDIDTNIVRISTSLKIFYLHCMSTLKFHHRTSIRISWKIKPHKSHHFNNSMLLIWTLTMQGTISSPLCKQTPTQCKTRKCKLSERHDGYSFIFLLAKQERTKKKARSTNKKSRERERESERWGENGLLGWRSGWPH